MAMTMLDKPLGDLRREIGDLQQEKSTQNYDMKKLGTIITISRDSLRETETFQQKLLQQLQQFEVSLADVNLILRANIEQKAELEQQHQLQSGIKAISFPFAFVLF